MDLWADYEIKMRLYNAGLLRAKPRVPFQHGRHIDTLPREVNTPADPHHIVMTKEDAEFFAKINPKAMH